MTTPKPATPTVPADVPRTGKNLLRKGEKPPVMPILATQHTAAGAKAFAEFFVKTIDWGYATTNGAYMHHYFTSSCSQCGQRYSDLEQHRHAGEYYIGDRLLLRKISESGTQKRQDVYLFNTTLDVSSNEILGRSGNLVDAQPAVSNVHFNLTVSWSENRWLVTFAEVKLS